MWFKTKSENDSWWAYKGYTEHEGHDLLLMEDLQKLILDYTEKETIDDRDALAYGRALSEAWMWPEMQSFQDRLVSTLSVARDDSKDGPSSPLCKKSSGWKHAPAEMKMLKGRSILAKVKGAISF